MLRAIGSRLLTHDKLFRAKRRFCGGAELSILLVFRVMSLESRPFGAVFFNGLIALVVAMLVGALLCLWYSLRNASIPLEPGQAVEINTTAFVLSSLLAICAVIVSIFSSTVLLLQNRFSKPGRLTVFALLLLLGVVVSAGTIPFAWIVVASPPR